MVITALTTITIAVIINIIFASISNAKEKTNDNIVRLPKVYGIVGIICFLGFAALVIISLNRSQDSSPSAKTVFLIFTSVFMLMCIAMSISCLNWRIKFGDETFEYRTMFRHTLRFKYSDITKVRRTKVQTILIKAKKRWLTIDPYAVGKDEFMQEMVRRTMDRKNIKPRKERGKKRHRKK